MDSSSKPTSTHMFSPVAVVVIAILFIFTGCGPKIKLTPLEPADPPVLADQGMVVAAHSLAAQAGIRILQEGGNAVDAALAALFMLNVVEPHASGLGGGGFALVRMANGDPKVVVYRENAPKAIDTTFYYNPVDLITAEVDSAIRAAAFEEVLNSFGNGDTSKLNTAEGEIALEEQIERLTEKELQSARYRRKSFDGTAICVPGAPAGWLKMHETWATLPIEELAKDAVEVAVDGFVVDPTLSGQIKNNYEKIMGDNLLSSTFLMDGIPYETGDTLRQPQLAKTFQFLIDNGLDSFYTSYIADSIAAASTRGGGFLSVEDMGSYACEISEAVDVDLSGGLAGFTALTVPPPSSGGTALIEALNLFEISGALEQEIMTAEAIHLMAQCQMQAYIDVDVRIEDPDFSSTDWRKLLTWDFAQKAGEGISLEAEPMARNAADWDKAVDHGNTSHLVVIDRWGNTVSLTQSINYFFGGGVMAPGTGLIMNNQMADFSLPPDSVNLLEGGKRPRSNMAPLILMKDDEPFLVVGTPGGSRIVSAVAQIVANVIAYDQDISSAIDLPRVYRGRDYLDMENRFSWHTIKRLKKIGYSTRFTGAYSTYFGGAHGILVDSATGRISGAADKRRGGAARGY